MLRVAVMVSGGGTNLQAIIDAVKDGTITNTELVAVISNNAGAYALTRAKDNNIPAYCISPKDYESRDAFNDALLDKVNELNVDLIVLAGFLVRIPEKMVHQYSHRIINIHPSLIPSFCGVGFYGLKVHEAALAKGLPIAGYAVQQQGGQGGEGVAQMERRAAVERHTEEQVGHEAQRGHDAGERQLVDGEGALIQHTCKDDNDDDDCQQQPHCSC